MGFADSHLNWPGEDPTFMQCLNYRQRGKTGKKATKAEQSLLF